ncbi:MAG TPA: GntR family transcriptional regulator [Thermodesulfobacteriota bacterium]|nr:GntR family transcriptional regulator [Thermodesulfobacteriota bacterium]
MQKIQSLSLGSQAYHGLKRIILEGRIGPGKKLNEGDLAKALGISRTPVREAINRLEKEGLVEIFPQRGAFVVRFSEKDIYELFLLRENLEGLAARLAAENMNDASLGRLESCVEGFKEPFNDKDTQRYAREDFKFHQTIVNLSDAKRLIRLVSTLHDHIRIYSLTTRGLSDRMKSSLKEHRQIIESLGRRDPDASDQAMRQHIRRVRDGVMENLHYFFKDDQTEPAPKEGRQWHNSATSLSKTRPKSFISEL